MKSIERQPSDQASVALNVVVHLCHKTVNVVVPFARLYNKCNKIRQQTDGVMGGTPLRDRRGGRLP